MPKQSQLVAVEVEPHNGGYRIVTRYRITGKGGAPRRVDRDRTYRSLALAVDAAQRVRASELATCEIKVKE